VNEIRYDRGQQDEVSEAQAKWTWFDLILISIGFGIIFLLGWSLLGILFRSIGVQIDLGDEPTLAQTLGLAAMETIALVGGVYFFGMRRRNLDWKEIGFKAIDNRWLLLVISISLLAIPITGLITLLVLETLDLPFENPQLEFFLPEGISFPGALGIMLFGGIAVPFAEELFFRGVLFAWLRKHWSMWPSLLASAFLFGLVHFDIAVGVTAFILGIVLGWVYEKSKSLWAPFLIHALNNSLRLLLLYILVAFGVIPGI
jgi:hypothetical protein